MHYDKPAGDSRYDDSVNTSPAAIEMQIETHDRVVV